MGGLLSNRTISEESKEEGVCEEDALCLFMMQDAHSTCSSNHPCHLFSLTVGVSNTLSLCFNMVPWRGG